MMRAACLPTLGILCFIGCSNPNENPAPLNEQIEKLASPRFREREDAAKWLRQHAAESLPELRKQRQHPDEDVRHRLDKLITEVEREVALQPSRVTLNVKDTPVSEVLKEIEKQTKCKVVLDEKMEDKLVSMKLQRATFWEAIQELERRTGYQVLRDKSDFVFGQDDCRIVHFQVQGIFRLILRAIYEERDIVFEENRLIEGKFESRRRVQLALYLQTEPRITILDNEQPSLISGKDDQGEAILSNLHDVRERSTGFEVFELKSHRNVNLHLFRPKEPSLTIRELQLRIPMKLVTDIRQVPVPGNLSTWKGQKVRLGKTQVEISTAEIKNDSLQIEIGMFGNFNMLCSSLFTVKFGSKRLNGVSGGTSGNDQQFSVRREYSLPQIAGLRQEDLKLFIEEWSVVDVEIPFEMRNIPLP